MSDMDKIHIKLELCKDKSSGLTIVTHFNPDAPNFFKENENYYWMPTAKERALLNEAFDLISTDKNGDPEEKNILKFLNKKYTQETIDDTKNESSYSSNLEKTKDAEDTYKYNNSTITEYDINEIDDTLEKLREKEGSNSKDNKEKIIQKILKNKKK